mmetsp:Transcript_1050/g.2770  ORF Transcript_1050/g.2770 Transcript_1050/m.2770 type:complete len:99 (+) Transcript_1050:573-869(+)
MWNGTVTPVYVGNRKGTCTTGFAIDATRRTAASSEYMSAEARTKAGCSLARIDVVLAFYSSFPSYSLLTRASKDSRVTAPESRSSTTLSARAKSSSTV